MIVNSEQRGSNSKWISSRVAGYEFAHPWEYKTSQDSRLDKYATSTLVNLLKVMKLLNSHRPKDTLQY